MPLNDFLPFALGAGSNVMTQAEYDALTARSSGFSSGTAKSRELNKVWRQSAFAVSCIAQFMADYTGSDILDDGDSASFKASFAKAISLLSMGTDYAVGANTGNAYTASFTPAVTALVDGMVLRFKAASANTGAATFSPDGLPAKPIVSLQHSALVASDIGSGDEVWLQYNSSVGGGSWVSLLRAPIRQATQTLIGGGKTASPADAVAGSSATLLVTPEALHAARMRRIARLSSAVVQAVSGTSTSPQTYAPLSYSFTADGGMYFIRVKLNANIQTDTGTGPSNAVVFKLLNGATPLDISAANITGNASWQGDCFVLEWSGPLSGAVALTVTFEKTYSSAIGSLSINGDRDDLTSNVSGQLSSIDIYRMGA